MEYPLVSVIIPVYKSEAYIGRALESVLSQTYTAIEIIVVNDGSPDNSEKIAKSYQEIDNRIIIISQENQGAAAALNCGTSRSKGNYLTYLDADDWLTTTAIEDGMDAIRNFGVDMVFWSYQKVKEKRLISTAKFFKHDKLFDSSNIDYLKTRIIGLNDNELSSPTSTDAISAGWGKLYTATIIRNKIFWQNTDVVGSSDVAFNNEVFLNLRKAYYLSKRNTFYFLDNPTSLTKNYGLTLFKKYLKLFEHIQKLNHSFIHYESGKNAFLNRIAMSLINLSLSITGAKGYTISDKYKIFNEILFNEYYTKSLNNLKTEYLPFSFRLFFYLAKNKFIILFYLYGCLIYTIRKWKN